MLGQFLGFGLLSLSLLCVAALGLDHWLTFRDLQRWERRNSRNGGYWKQRASTALSQPTGTVLPTGEVTPLETTEACKLTLILGDQWHQEASRPIRLVPAFNNSYLWPIESGKPTGENGEDSGLIPPGSVA